uniref:Tox-REase-5 domain-containing protein n=1 Tax=uncultured Actinomyces sp. TaxID=249061 RepID=UPI0026182427
PSSTNGEHPTTALRLTPSSNNPLPTTGTKLVPMNIGLTLLAGATILLSGSTLGLTFKVGAGVITVLGSARAQRYEEQVTGVPIKHSYIVNGTEFDGYDGFALIDAKGPGYDPLIKGDWSREPKSTPRKVDPVTGKVTPKKKGLIETAEDQVEAVRATGTDTPIQWHIAEKDTFDDLFNRQKSGEFPAEIELIHTPPN